MRVEPRLLQVERRPTEVRAPGSAWAGVRQVAVVRHDRLGDLLLTLPAISALRRTYRDARIALLVDPALVELGWMIDGVDTAIGVSSTGQIRRRLVDLGTDLAVCVSRGAGPAWAAWRAEISHRVGTGRRFYSPLFQRRVGGSRRRGGRHEAEHALAFAHRAGAVPGPAEFPLKIPDSARERTARWLASCGISNGPVVLHPGSGGSCPRWPRGHFLRLAERLRSEGLAVVVSLGPGETAPTPDGVHPFAAALPELAALVERARLVVSNSTGPIHLAAALDRPSLAIHAPWASCGVSRWGPYSERGWGLVVHHPDAEGWSRAERRRRAPALMRALAPEAVASCCLQGLRTGTPRL